MRRAINMTIYMLCVAMIILLPFGTAFGMDSQASDPLLPEGLTTEDDFKPGLGAPVGKIIMAKGEAIIIHQGLSIGYRAQKGLPIFKGDTVITQSKARLRLSLNDGSIITLASETKLTVNRSVYDPRNKSRSTFLGMETGKARFWAVKMKGFKYSEFKVKTKTAVAGIRGSDFIINATAIFTEITTLKDTLLELISLAMPEAEPLLLSDFKRSQVAEGALPTKAEDVDFEEIEQMMKEFLFSGERFDPDKMIEAGEEKEAGKEEDEISPSKDLGAVPGVTTGILFSDGELVKPDLTNLKNEMEEFQASNIDQSEEPSRAENDIEDQQSNFYQEKQEDNVTDAPGQLPPPVDGP